MSYLPPVDQKASPAAELVDDLEGAPAGAFQFYNLDRPAIKDAGIILNCPCGCGTMISMPFTRRPGNNRPGWTWDGNREQPTCLPSLLIHQIDERGRIIGEHWHGFLSEGVWRSCT